MRSLIIAVLLAGFGYTNGYSAPAPANGSKACIQFSVLTQDTLKNLKPGLSPKDQKWFRKKVEKKNPSLCYVEPSSSAPLMFVVVIARIHTTAHESSLTKEPNFSLNVV